MIDFGLSNYYKPNSQLITACGSPCYASPEIIKSKHYNGLKTDIWSSGIVLYAMIVGNLPFEDSNTSILYEKIKEGDFEIPLHVSE